MSILYILIPIGLILLAAAVGIFFWAVGNGQFDDLESPAMSIFDKEDQKD